VKSLSAALLMLLGVLAPVSQAHAHAQSTSFLVADLAEGNPVRVRWDLSVHDLIWSVFIDADYDGLATWQEIQDARGAIGNAALAQISVSRGGAACGLRVEDLALANRADQNFVSLSLLAQCPMSGRLAIGGPLFMTGDVSQRVLLSAHRGPQTFAGVMSAASPGWSEPEKVSGWVSFARFVGEGVWHVLIGYDHIAFVLLLLLPSVMRPVEGRWQGATGLAPVARDIVTIVTAFTIAHSTTLALAVTGTLVLPAQPIEVAIAASIAIAALLNLLPRLSGWRLPLAFGFGFVHGFGFANALSEIDAAGTALLPLLAGFNIGVEVAQLGIVAVVLPLIYLARTRRWYSSGVLPLGSCALGAAGLVWLVQRL
jgi:hypothetical protein